MSNIDQRVVEMQFDNKAFGSNIKTSLDDLANLKKGLQLDGATKGIGDVQGAVNKFDMSSMDKAVENTRNKIDVFRIFAVSAIYTISSQIVHMGENLVKSLTVAPISAGLQSYADQINATQTILANTQAAGVGLKQVTGVLAELQDYANKTVYSFSDMTKNIGTFTAAGVDLNTSVSAIKGIANLSAMSGSSAEQASTAMYQLSQAIAAGQVHLQDWNSVVNAGIGGKTFQNALINTAKAHGVAIDAIIKKQGSFRESLQKGWLTSGILTDTLKQFTGDLSDAQLKSMGYTNKQIADIQKLGKTALASAVNIRTIPQMMQALKEEVATAYAAIFKTVFGDINQATSLFTDLHNTVENALTGPLYAFNKVLQGWAALGGRVALIEGLKMGFADLMAIVKPFKDAFREIFPPATAEGLLSITASFRVLMGHLKIGVDTANDLKRTFAGFFAILDIGWQLVKEGAEFIGTLIGHFSQGTGGVLKFSGGVGDMLTNLDKAIKAGNIFGHFFEMITPWIEKPVDALKTFVGFIVSLVKNITGVAGATDILGRFNAAGQTLSNTGDKVTNAFDGVKRVITAVWMVIEPILGRIGKGIENVTLAIGSLLSGVSVGDVIGAAGVTGFLTLVKSIKSTLDSFLHPKDTGPSVLDKVRDSLEQLTGTLKAMQNALKAATLLEIAIAIGILTLALSQLSKIDAPGLKRSSVAIGAMLVELGGIMLLMGKLTGQAKAIKMDVVAAGMILVATAIDILASAAVKMSKLSDKDLQRGLQGTLSLLTEVAITMKIMPNKERMISNGLGIIALAEGIKILVDSVKDLGSMSWEQLKKGLSGVAGVLLALGLFEKFGKADRVGILNGTGIILLATGLKIIASVLKDIGQLSWGEIEKGLTGIAGALVSIAVALRIMPWGDLGKATSLVIVAAALKILAGVVKDMGKLSWSEIGRGMTVLAGGLGLIVVALNLMPWGNLAKASGLVIVGAALKIIGSAVKDMSGLSWEEIGRGMTTLAGALGIITVALNLMPWGNLAKAGALLVVSAALKVLASAMKDMGGMSWSEIAKSLVELAGSLTIISVALLLLDGALPGAAALVVVAGGLAIMTPVLKALGDMSWSDIGAALGVLAGLFTILAVAGVASPLIMALSAALAVFGLAVAALGLGVLAVGAGIAYFADGISTLSKINAQGIHNLAAALDTLAGKIPKLAVAMALGLVDFVKTIGDHAKDFGDAVAKMLDQFIRIVNQKMPQAVVAMASGLLKMLTVIDKNMPEFVTKGTSILVKFLAGLAKNMPKIGEQGTAVAVAFLRSVGQNAGKMSDAGFKMVIDTLNGVAKSIRDNAGKLRDAGANIAGAILSGITFGLSDKVGGVLSKIGDIGGGMIDKMKHALDSHSPSREFMKIGTYVTQGLVVGLTAGQSSVDSAVQNLGNSLTTAVQNSADATVSAQNKLNSLIAARAANTHAMAQAEAALARAENSSSKGRAAAIAAAEARIFSLRQAAAKNSAAIQAEQASLNQARLEHARDTAALAVTQSNVYLDEQDKLDALSLSYDDYTQKIKDATSALDAATKTRDDYDASLKTSYGTEQTVTKDTHLSDYIANLQQQIVDTQNFAIAIQELRKNGLNDEMYKQLLADGTSVMPFVQELLKGGANSIVQLNTLGATLDKSAGNIADSASSSLYQAAVDSAAGFLKGLQDQQAAIEAQMNKIATSMVGAIKKALGIKSPSQEFANIGAYSAQGLVQGLEASSGLVSSSAEKLGNKAIDSMRKTISGLGKLISDDMDNTVVVRPVIDLTHIKANADLIKTMLTLHPITVGHSYDQAYDAAQGYAANQAAAAPVVPAEPVPPFTFIQNNTSPKELSQSEIYRNTNNQLAVAKGALTRSRANQP